MVVRKNGKMKKPKVLNDQEKALAELKKITGYLIAAFRRIWRWSKARKDALKGAKCLDCGELNDLQADHIDPVVPLGGLNVVNGHIDFNQLFERMFYGALAARCETCHKAKSKVEAGERKKIRDARKADSK